MALGGSGWFSHGAILGDSGGDSGVVLQRARLSVGDLALFWPRPSLHAVARWRDLMPFKGFGVEGFSSLHFWQGQWPLVPGGPWGP